MSPPCAPLCAPSLHAALPIFAAPISAVGRVQAGQLPAATVARTVYHGSYEGLGDAWAEFGTWIDQQGHTDRKSTRLNSSHLVISYAVFCLRKKNQGHCPNYLL